MENRITGHTKLYCLIGSPVGHSGSPAMYNYSFARTGVDGAYLAFDVPLDQVGKAIEAIKTFQVKGFNITMPDKTAVMDYLDEISPAARMIGACNTVVVSEEGKLIGYNTDGRGFTDNLRAHGVEVKGKKLGVIGLGAIGAEVANIAIDLGMDVYGYDPYVSVGAAWRISSAVHHVTNLDDIFRTCDYMTIHVPAMEGTIGMIDERACSLMKDGAVFLNFSRDTLVDNAAMAAALDSGKVHAYITDFATPEVMKMERAIVLPHLGASTAEAEDNCAMMAVRELMDYLENGNIANSVNYPACDMGSVPDGLRRVAVLHANVPNAIARITNVFGDAGVNVENMTNKARGENAYTMLDLDAGTPGHPDDAIERLSAIEGVRRVRVVK